MDSETSSVQTQSEKSESGGLGAAAPMSLPDFGGIEMARYAEDLLAGKAGPPHSWGAVPDIWMLESTISENKEEWWGESPCGVEGCQVPACQVDPRGYRCEDHR